MNKELIMKLGEQENDPYRHLYFEKDMENGGRGEVCLYDLFMWDRKKSNKNIKKHGFSFYLALHIFKGFVDNIQDVGVKYSWTGFPFENKELGLFSINGKFHKKMLYFREAFEGEVSGHTAWWINQMESYYGLRSDPNFEEIYDARQRDLARSILQARLNYKKEHGRYPMNKTDDDMKKLCIELGVSLDGSSKE